MTGAAFLRAAALAAACATLAACAGVPETASRGDAAPGVLPLPAMKTFDTAEVRPSRAANADIARDFLDLAFALESGRVLDRLTRFDGAITLRLTGQPPPSLRGDLSRLLARLRDEAGIPVVRTNAADAAITIEAVPRAAIRGVLPEAACFVVPNVSSLDEYRAAADSARTRWSELRTRTRLAIFVPADASPQEARDCLHEELAQALGPLNDLYRLNDSVFNDDNFHTVLTGFDMLILRVHYDPALRTGMTRAEVAARLPAILARLNPAGEGRAPRGLPRTPQAWSAAIQAALGPGTPQQARRRAAAEAVTIARDAGWTDHRRGFAHFVQGRLIQGLDPDGARAEYETALRHFGSGPETAVHRAYASAQLAAHALSDGDGARAEAQVVPHLGTAVRAENAALLASLMLLRAEALDLTGRAAEARALRLDSLGWARYGFGPDWAVRAKLDEVGALRPAQDFGGSS